MIIELVRHATLLVSVNDKKLLVDPMFSNKGALDPVAQSNNTTRNPLVDLPCTISELLDIDAILITHTHRDHLDDAAIQVLPKNIPCFCQPEDEEKLISLGFSDVHSIPYTYVWENIQLFRTTGQHGKGELARKMGPVSGYIIKSELEPTLYITGDTIWCPEVENALATYLPDITVVFSGAAQFSYGDPITMTVDDIKSVCDFAPYTKVIAAHLESWNHCYLTRKELDFSMKQTNLNHQVSIPNNGEALTFNNK